MESEKYKLWKAIYLSVGKYFEPLGYIFVLIYSIIINRKSIDLSLKLLGWYNITPEMVASASTVIATVVMIPFLPFLLLAHSTLGLGLWLSSIVAVGAYLYQKPDEFTFIYKYDYTNYLTLAMQILAIELIRSGNLNKAVLLLADMNLGKISYIIKRDVVSKYYPGLQNPSIEEKFRYWLMNECPYPLFTYYVSNLIIQQNSDLMKAVIKSAQADISRLLRYQLERTVSRNSFISMALWMMSILFAMVLSAIGGVFKTENSIVLTIFVFVFYIIFYPFITYDFFATMYRRVYIMESFE